MSASVLSSCSITEGSSPSSGVILGLLLIYVLVPITVVVVVVVDDAVIIFVVAGGSCRGVMVLYVFLFFYIFYS